MCPTHNLQNKLPSLYLKQQLEIVCLQLFLCRSVLTNLQGWTPWVKKKKNELVLTPLEADTPPALRLGVKRGADWWGPWCAGGWCPSGCWCLWLGCQRQGWPLWGKGPDAEPGPRWAPWRCGRPPPPGRVWPLRGPFHWPGRRKETPRSITMIIMEKVIFLFGAELSLWSSRHTMPTQNQKQCSVWEMTHYRLQLVLQGHSWTTQSKTLIRKSLSLINRGYYSWLHEEALV